MRGISSDQYNAMNDLMNSQQMAMQNIYGLGALQAGSPQPRVPASSQNPYIQPQTSPTLKKEKSMFKEIVADMRSFILEHRSVIYFLAFALMVDHFVFRGAFKARLQGCVDRMITKVEEKIQ